MAAAILPTTLSMPRPSDRRFSSLNILTGGDHLHLEFRHLSLQPPSRFPCPPIRMGGGPRTFPGGVSKWQWKRMQAKKAKQLLKARLIRERQIYEMRKRTELKAAVSELERPWEVVERAPNLFSVSADEQLKTLADRFQRPGGFDMWSDRDGPQVFSSPDGVQSTRFFPKGAVHSIKPYGAATEDGEKEDLRFDDWIARGGGNTRKRRTRRSSSTVVDIEVKDSNEGNGEEEQSGKIVRSSHRISAARDSLRPGAELYAEDGRNRMRDYSGGSRVRDGTCCRFGLDGAKTRGKFAERNDGGRGDRRTDVERVSLRPTADLYGGYGSMEKRDRFQQGGRFGKEKAVKSDGEGQHGKNGGRGNLRTNAGRGRGRANAGSVSLRPSANFYAEDGGYRNRDCGRANAGSVSLRPSANFNAEDGGYRNRDFRDSSSRERRKRSPSANLYAEDGGYRKRDYSDGSSSERGQISEKSSRFESYATHTVGNGEIHHRGVGGRSGGGRGRGSRRIKDDNVLMGPVVDVYGEDGGNISRNSSWG